MAELAAGTLEEEPGWPELLPFMFQCVQSGEVSRVAVEVDVLCTGSWLCHLFAPPLPRMYPCAFLPSVQQPRLMESALLIFAQLAHYVISMLLQYMGTLHSVLQVL